jgi:2-polyprenyl-6-methoxyphenol hydroxylase-like FAD-dependent oxidoreductase
MTHALIIGGGIAGASAALALGKAGVTSTVYEAYPTGGDDVGAFLLVMPNGIDALRAIDAEQAVIERSFPTPDVEYLDPADNIYASGPMGRTHAPRTLKRADLYLALQENCSAGAERSSTASDWSAPRSPIGSWPPSPTAAPPRGTSWSARTASGPPPAT